MRNSTIIPIDAQEHFWSVVEACVREFHTAEAEALLPKVALLRTRIEQLPIEDLELFFHTEPFDVACRLAKRPLPVQDYLERYLALRDLAADATQ